MHDLTKVKDAFSFDNLLAEAFRESGTSAREFRDESFFEGLQRVLAIPWNIDISASGVSST